MRVTHEIALGYKDIYLVPNKCVVRSRQEVSTSYTLNLGEKDVTTAEDLFKQIKVTIPDLKTFKLPIIPANMKSVLDERTYEKYSELAAEYNEESIDALANIFTDLFTLIGFILVANSMRPQLIILKSFITELLYSFGDTTKSFLLLFITDLFVGFHSPHGWEVFLEAVIDHFGFAENEDFVFLFVATFPVLIDTVVKYWIFRYLNKLSPSTVATYHSMIE
jgi:hypothetical protein